jgi:hypothetical protein
VPYGFATAGEPDSRRGIALQRLTQGNAISVISRQQQDYQQSLRVIGRFCTIVLFFACWAAVRHWPHPLYSLSNMLRVAFAACLAFALVRREPFADTSLNYWDEGLGYIATAALVDAL